MKKKEIISGLLEVGDHILVDNGLFKYQLTISRVTKTMAFAISAYNPTYEYKFKRIINSRVKPLHRERWNTTSYLPYREVDV